MAWLFFSTFRNIFDHPVSQAQNRGVTGEMDPVFLIYLEYSQPTQLLLNYLLKELEENHIQNSGVEEVLLHLKEELSKHSISLDDNKWLKKVMKPVIPLSVSPSKREVSEKGKVLQDLNSLPADSELFQKVRALIEAEQLAKKESSTTTTTTDSSSNASSNTSANSTTTPTSLPNVSSTKQSASTSSSGPSKPVSSSGSNIHTLAEYASQGGSGTKTRVDNSSGTTLTEQSSGRSFKGDRASGSSGSSQGSGMEQGSTKCSGCCTTASSPKLCPVQSCGQRLCTDCAKNHKH